MKTKWNVKNWQGLNYYDDYFYIPTTFTQPVILDKSLTHSPWLLSLETITIINLQYVAYKEILRNNMPEIDLKKLLIPQHKILLKIKYFKIVSKATNRILRSIRTSSQGKGKTYCYQHSLYLLKNYIMNFSYKGFR